MSERVISRAPAELAWQKGEFRTLYIRHQAALYQFALLCLGEAEAAQDLVFEVMREVWSSGARAVNYDFLHSERTHLLHIACRESDKRDTVSNLTIAPELMRDESNFIADLGDLVVNVEAAKDQEWVENSVAELGQLERQVLHLTLYENMGDQVISHIIGCTPEQVRKTMALVEHNLMHGLSLQRQTPAQPQPKIHAKENHSDE